MKRTYTQRQDLKFFCSLKGRSFHALRPGECLSIAECAMDLKKLSARMRRYGMPRGRAYEMKQAGSTVYIGCYVEQAPPRLRDLPRRKTRSRDIIAGVKRQKTQSPTRTRWQRMSDGRYECEDAGVIFEIRRDGNAAMPWRIYRNGVALVKSHTVYDAKAEAARLS